MKTILDVNPYYAYARLLRSTVENRIDSLITNFDGEVDKGISYKSPPRIVKFGDRLFIDGSPAEVTLGSTFIRDNPNYEHHVDHFEDPEIAKSRFISLFGYSYSTYDQEVPEEEEEIVGESIIDFLTEARSQSDVAIMLKSYILGFSRGRVSNKAPYLLGHSGIAKSAIVYEVIKELDAPSKELSIKDIQDQAGADLTKWGYKLIEVKAGFLDKVDFMGYVSDTESDSGQSAWNDSPKTELLLCSTEFVNECRKFITDLKEAEITPENMHFISKIRYYAKTPVLFLDEVNRAPEMVINQIMPIVNQNRLDRYDLSIAPKIGAANELIEMEGIPEEDKELFNYNVTKAKDIAAISRWNQWEVSGEDASVIQNTFNYLADPKKGKFKDSPWALTALNWALKKRKLYDHKLVDKYGKFPTFRGWEDVCTYLAYVEKNQPGIVPLLEVFHGLLGLNINPSDFLSVELDQSKSTDLFIKHSLDAGLPCSLIGRAGVAKTSKVEQYAKDLRLTYDEVVVEYMDLPVEDRTTVNGMPKKKNFLTTVFNNTLPKEYRHDEYKKEEDESISSTSLFKAFEEKVKMTGVPKETTIVEAKVGIQNTVHKLKQSIANGKKVKLILFFDEFNRANPIVQSCIFEAVSLKRFRGIDLEGIDFSIVTAGNWQSRIDVDINGKHYNVTPIDTASLHRSCTKVIESYEKEDIDSFMEVLRKKHPLAYNMFNKVYKNDPAKLQNTLNYKHPGDEDIMFDSKMFSFREITGLEELMHQYDVDMTQGLMFDDINKIVAILGSSHYILSTLEPEATMDWSQGADLRPLFVQARQKEITYKEFSSKSVVVLQDPAVEKDIKIRIISLLRFLEDDLFAMPKKYMMNTLPKDDGLRKFVSDIMNDGYMERTGARIATLLIHDNLFGSVEEATRAVNKKIADSDPMSLVTEFEQYIVFLLKDATEKVPLSKIIKAVEIYNGSTGAKQSVGMFLSISDIVNRLLMDFGSKIKMDYAKKLTLDMKDIFNRKIDKELLSVLGDHIIWDDVLAGKRHVDDPDVRTDVDQIHVGYHFIDQNHIIPDLFTLTASNTKNSDKESSMTLDDSTFKVEISGGKSIVNLVKYTYTGTVGIYDLTIHADAINEFGKNRDKVISDTALDDPSIIVKKNLSSFVGVVKSIEIHGGSVDDIPDLDKTEIHKLHNTKVLVTSNKKQNKIANFAMLFKRSFGGIEKLFS